MIIINYYIPRAPLIPLVSDKVSVIQGVHCIHVQFMHIADFVALTLLRLKL